MNSGDYCHVRTLLACCVATGLAAAPLPAAAQGCAPEWRTIPGTAVPGPGAIDSQVVWDPDGSGPLTPRLVVGGAFDIAGLPEAHNLAVWDGSSWSALGSGMQGTVWQLAASSDGALYALEEYTTPQGQTAFRVWHWDGNAWNVIGVPDDYTFAMAMLPDGELVLGGWFWHVNGLPLSCAARWNGTTWLPLSSDWIFAPRRLTVTPSGELVGTGDLVSADYEEAYYAVARWTGDSWERLGDAFNEVPQRVCALADGRIVASNGFSYVGTTPARNVVLWDGSTWQPIGNAISGGCVSLAPLPNGDFVVGGSGISGPGFSDQSVVRWNGSSWVGLGIGSNTEEIYSMGPAPGGEGIVACGSWIVPGPPSSRPAYVAHWTETNAPWVSEGPAPASLNELGTLTLTAIPADGYSNVEYQWLRNGVPISDGPGGASLGGGTVSGASGSLPSPTAHSVVTLAVEQTRLSDAGEYSITFTNPCGSASGGPVQVSVLCLSDYDANTFVNGDDFDAFVYDFEYGVSQADVDHNGFVNGDDFDRFVEAFSAGC